MTARPLPIIRVSSVRNATHGHLGDPLDRDDDDEPAAASAEKLPTVTQLPPLPASSEPAVASPCGKNKQGSISDG